MKTVIIDLFLDKEVSIEFWKSSAWSRVEIHGCLLSQRFLFRFFYLHPVKQISFFLYSIKNVI